jgi:hypothetical protein
MSGVSPGTRTLVFQRVRLWPQQGQSPGPVWAQLLWTAEPPGCTLYRQGEDGLRQTPPLVQLETPAAAVAEQLISAVEQSGWRLQSCGSCRFWQPTQAQTVDGVRMGLCRVAPTVELPTVLAQQSALALDCPHWVSRGQPLAEQVVPLETVNAAPLPKVAEISESKLKFWPRLRRRVGRWFQPASPPPGWAEKLAERTGVGAGAEACFVCQGRIANLGALAVATPDGDTQTFSIWRCRNCFTTYLNDWIDRWVRLESLETEERYYRIAPAEALALLTVIEGAPGGEHPGGRHQRTAERAHLLAFLASRTPLSHQIRQGR